MTYFAGYTWIVGAWLIAASSVSSELLSGAALVAIVGGVAAAIFTAKTHAEKAALLTQVELERGAAEAWKIERDAEVAKADRLAQDLRTEAAARVAAEARTDITRLEQQVVDNHKQTLQNHSDVVQLVGGLRMVLEEIAKNTAPPVITHQV